MAANAEAYQELLMPTPESVAKWWDTTRRAVSEEGVIDFVAKLSPWIAPLPSSWFVHDATIRHLTGNNGLAWTIAIVIETLGLTTTHTALGMHGWNRAHQGQPEKQAPFALSVVLALVYILATLTLITVLEVFPDWQHYAPAMFPILAVVGAVNLALRSHHNTRIRAENETTAEEKMRKWRIEDEEREQRLEERRQRAAAKYGFVVANVPPTTVSNAPSNGTSAVSLLSDIQNVTPNVTPNVTGGRLTKSQRQAAIRDYLTNNKDPGASELGRMFGVDRKTIYRDIETINGKAE